MTRYALIASLFLTLGLVGVAWFQTKRVDVLNVQLEQANNKIIVRDLIIEQHNSAVRIHKNRIQELERESEELRVELDSLTAMEGRDAPLSDLLRATGNAVDRLLRTK